MFSPGQWIQGVEWIWLVWLVSLAIVFKMSCQALRRWRRPCWVVLARDEEGVSYSLSFVLLIPFYLLFVCVVFESTWLLLAKVGTLYAAHAGARSAVVWASAQPANLRTTRINQSVWSAMTPFATGSPSWLGLSGDAFGDALDYAAAYNLYSPASNDPNAQPGFGTMTNRYLTAASRTSWQQQVDTSRPDGDLTVTVTYRAPLHIPGAARILNPNGSQNEYSITSKATLPNEAPASANGTLGIDYESH
jgi:Flp pilus assembly protein TadG